MISIESKLTTIAKNMPLVYDAGYNAGLYATDPGREMGMKLWNAITNYGARKDYQNAFRYADFSDLEFIKPVVVGQGSKQATAAYMFRYYRGTRLPRNIDLSNISTTATHSELFHYAQQLQEIEDIGIPELHAYQNTFYMCTDLTKIHKIRVNENTSFSGTFTGCESLEEVWFDGTIGKNISFANSPNLTLECVEDILNRLKDFSSSGEKRTITFHPNVISNQIEQLPELAEEVSQKGWTIIS